VACGVRVDGLQRRQLKLLWISTKDDAANATNAIQSVKLRRQHASGVILNSCDFTGIVVALARIRLVFVVVVLVVEVALVVVVLLVVVVVLIGLVVVLELVVVVLVIIVVLVVVW